MDDVRNKLPDDPIFDSWSVYHNHDEHVRREIVKTLAQTVGNEKLIGRLAIELKSSWDKKLLEQGGSLGSTTSTIRRALDLPKQK